MIDCERLKKEFYEKMEEKVFSLMLEKMREVERSGDEL